MWKFLGPHNRLKVIQVQNQARDMCGNEVWVKKQKTDLMLFCVTDTTETMLNELGWKLYRFEAKRKTYNFDEDHSVHFVV